MDEFVVIDLFGEEFRFRPDHQVKNPEQVVQQLKKYIDEAEELFGNTSSTKNKLIILLLASINLSKDFYELKVQYSEFEEETEDRISSLIKKINKVIE